MAMDNIRYKKHSKHIHGQHKSLAEIEGKSTRDNANRLRRGITLCAEMGIVESRCVLKRVQLCRFTANTVPVNMELWQLRLGELWKLWELWFELCLSYG